MIVHADAMPVSERTLERLEPITRQDSEVSQGRGGVHVRQLATYDLPQRFRNRSRPLRIFVVKDVFSCGIAERPNHLTNYTRLPGVR